LSSTSQVTSILAVWLGAWLAASIALQILPRQTRMRRSWLAWALPEWRFFAPNPSTFDYALFYRTSVMPDVVQRAQIPCTPSGRWRWLWNPPGREQKVFRDLADAVQLFARSSDRDDQGVSDAVCLSDPYILLLSYCASRMSDSGVAQFGILRLTPGASDQVVFLSRWHRCP